MSQHDDGPERDDVMTQKDGLPPGPGPKERPDEKARQERSPDEAADESKALVENETKQGDRLPPQEEDYGGTADERTRKR